MPASYHVFEGVTLGGDTETGETGRGTATLAVVNDAVAATYEDDTGRYRISSANGRIRATKLIGAKGKGMAHGIQCSEDCEHHHHVESPAFTCEVTDGISTISAVPGAATAQVTMDAAIVLDALPSGQPGSSETWVDHQFFRFGPKYDASLRYAILWASAKDETGPTSQLAATAAEYFTIAARSADTYERQLGLRYLLTNLS